MKRSEQDRLLKEILGSEETTALREESLQAGLASLRSRQKHQRAIRVSIITVAAFVIAGALVLHRAPSTPQPLAEAAPPAPPEASAAAQVKFISDEELLALFSGRAVALIGKPGEQQRLVFLDAPKKADQEEL